jgi:hypothetical protein
MAKTYSCDYTSAGYQHLIMNFVSLLKANKEDFNTVRLQSIQQLKKSKYRANSLPNALCVGTCEWGGLRQHVQEENHNAFEERKRTIGVCICSKISENLHRLTPNRSKSWMDVGIYEHGGHLKHIIQGYYKINRHFQCCIETKLLNM